MGRSLQTYGGGKGANAAVAAARAGARVLLIGAVGADDTGAAALAELQREGIDTGAVAVLADESTGVALIVVDARGENQIAVGAGANAALSTEHVRQALHDALPTAGCVLVSTEIPPDAVAAAVEMATAAKVACVLNPAPVLDVISELLAFGPVLTPNDSELGDLASLTGDDAAGGDALTVATHVAGRSGQAVIVTQGGAGVALVGADGHVAQIPAPAVTVKDTTGAGDTFNGVLAARLARGDALAVATRVAVVAASLSVTAVGARGGMPVAAAIDAAIGAT